MSDMKEMGQANGGDGNIWMDKLSHVKDMKLHNPLFSLHTVDSILTIKRKPMLQHQLFGLIKDGSPRAVAYTSRL